MKVEVVVHFDQGTRELLDHLFPILGHLRLGADLTGELAQFDIESRYGIHPLQGIVKLSSFSDGRLAVRSERLSRRVVGDAMGEHRSESSLYGTPK